MPQVDAQVPWQGSYLRQVRPLRWVLQGRAVFHGGAVCRQGRALALLGPSGRGKSTLTAACAGRGFQFLTDDCLVIEGLDPPMVQPDLARVRLHGDSMHALAGDQAKVLLEACEPGEKPALPADDRMPHASTPVPLACALVLAQEPADAISLEPMSSADAAMAWCANAFVIDQKAAAPMRAMMRRAAALAAAVPVFGLSFPRDYRRLDEVVEVVAGALADADAGRRTMQPLQGPEQPEVTPR